MASDVKPDVMADLFSVSLAPRKAAVTRTGSAHRRA
jgi:hypothetical protein